MNLLKSTGWFILLLLNGQVYAFETVDEQINHYLDVLANDGYSQKIEMLKRLQWSGLSNPRFYDKIAEELASQSTRNDLNRKDIGVYAYQVRALGYSGNEKYRSALEQIRDTTVHSKLKKHARKALLELELFSRRNNLIANSNVEVSGKSVEVTIYMKMLGVDDPRTQRMAARASFIEKRSDPDLLAMIAENLKASYLKSGLSKQAQDTAAWYCKALGVNGFRDYGELLADVARDSPYGKLKKHARKYAQ